MSENASGKASEYDYWSGNEPWDDCDTVHEIVNSTRERDVDIYYRIGEKDKAQEIARARYKLVKIWRDVEESDTRFSTLFKRWLTGLF